jgi:glutaredoxin
MPQAASKFGCLLFLLVAASPLQAGIYKWVDADGNIHYTDTPPENQQQSLEITGRISSYDSPEIVPADSGGDAAAAASKTGTDKSAKSKRVVMYSAEWCGVCKRAKQYFTEKNIRFTEYDIDKNPKAKADFDKMGGRGVPVILVGNRRMNGFSAGGFEQLYSGK